MPSVPSVIPEPSPTCPGCGEELHPQLRGPIFRDRSLPKATAVYFCGTYLWEDGSVDVGCECRPEAWAGWRPGPITKHAMLRRGLIL